MMIIVYLTILLVILGYFVFGKKKNRPVRNYYVVKAGSVQKLSPLQLSVNSLQGKRFRIGNDVIEADDYEIYIVDGESMAPCGIHTGNGILVSRLLDKSKLNIGDIVIIEIDPSRFESKSVQNGFKLRQFLCYSDFSKNDNEIISQVEMIDKKLKDNYDCESRKLSSKLQEAREQGLTGKIAVSLTTKDSERTYSIHPVHEIYGVCRYVIPKKLIKYPEQD